jgi:hypothetical protein
LTEPAQCEQVLYEEECDLVDELEKGLNEKIQGLTDDLVEVLVEVLVEDFVEDGLNLKKINNRNVLKTILILY